MQFPRPPSRIDFAAFGSRFVSRMERYSVHLRAPLVGPINEWWYTPAALPLPRAPQGRAVAVTSRSRHARGYVRSEHHSSFCDELGVSAAFSAQPRLACECGPGATLPYKIDHRETNAGSST